MIGDRKASWKRGGNKVKDYEERPCRAIPGSFTESLSLRGLLEAGVSLCYQVGRPRA